MLLIKLAFRNVFRNFKRSLLTFLSITVGLALSIMTVAFSLGFENSSIRTGIQTRTGHIKIYSDKYDFDSMKPDLENSISKPQTVYNILDKNNDVVDYSGRILFAASLTDGIDELPIAGLGIDTEKEGRIFGLSEAISNGRYFNPDEEMMLISDKIAELFGFEVGDFVTILTRTKYNSVNAYDLEICGTFKVNNPEVDSGIFFLPIKFAEELLDMPGEVSEVVLFTTTDGAAADLNAELMPELASAGFKTQDWNEQMKDMMVLFKMRAKSRQIIYFILFIMAAAGVANTMLMSVFERIREIGTLLAMGMKKNSIIKLFSYEAAFIGVLGSITGAVIGGFVSYYYKANGISMEAMGMGEVNNLPISPMMYAHIDMGIIFFAFLLGVGTAVISGIYPAVKGSKLHPSEALRSN